MNLILHFIIWYWNCNLLLLGLDVLVPIRILWKTHCLKMAPLVQLRLLALILRHLDLPASWLPRTSCPTVCAPRRLMLQMLWHLDPEILIPSTKLSIIKRFHISRITYQFQIHTLKVKMVWCSSVFSLMASQLFMVLWIKDRVVIHMRLDQLKTP